MPVSSVEPPPAADPIEAKLEAIALCCSMLAQRLASLTPATISNARRQTGDIPALVQLRRYLRARRLRDQLFPADLFADPAWDMLLDLYASELEGRAVSVSSACIASAVPATTALRWLGRLEELELVRRADDKNDKRQTFVLLTESARNAIVRWLEETPALVSWEEEFLTRGAPVLSTT
jgi:DNA-binding MarR family transcriptional regulator